MNILFNPIVTLACLCFLVMQSSGMHFHVDEHGKDAGVHSAHQHLIDSEDHQDHHHQLSNVHEHKAEIDISSQEMLGSIWTRLIPAIMTCALVTTIASIGLHQPIRSLLRAPARVRRLSRWRPPLRAPPISL